MAIKMLAITIFEILFELYLKRTIYLEMNGYEKCLWDEWNRIEREVSQESEKLEKLDSFFADVLENSEKERSGIIRTKRDNEESRPQFEMVDYLNQEIDFEPDEYQPEGSNPDIQYYATNNYIFILAKINVGKISEISSSDSEDQLGYGGNDFINYG